MSFITEVIAYLSTHYLAIIGFVLAAVAFAEAAVRLTPTQKDDGAVERIGKRIRKVIDMLDKIFPNKKAGGGSHPTLKEKEKE